MQYKFNGPRDNQTTYIEAETLTDAHDINQAVILLDRLQDVEIAAKEFLEEKAYTPTFSYSSLLSSFIDGNAKVEE